MEDGLTLIQKFLVHQNQKRNADLLVVLLSDTELLGKIFTKIIRL